MDNYLLKKLKGYHSHCRQRHIIALKLNMTDGEYRLWDLLTACAGWDEKNTETFTVTKATDEKLAELLPCSPSTVCRNRKLLIKKGLIEQIGRSTYKIKLLPDKELGEFELAAMQEKLARMQEAPGVLPKSSLISFKGDCVPLPKKALVKKKIRKGGEYQEIYKNGPYQGLTPDDMKWVDENIFEKRAVSDEATEADYVEIFFGGDWRRYRDNLVTESELTYDCRLRAGESL